MAIEKVRAYFAQFNRQQDILEFESSSATVELAAQVLGVEPARIAKTLSFKKDDGCVLIVAAGDVRIDNSKFKQQFGVKAKMLKADEVVEYTGHAIGGVCPFALPGEKVLVYADASLKAYQTVFPACGSSNSAIELTPDELYQYAQCQQWIDVAKENSCQIGRAHV